MTTPSDIGPGMEILIKKLDEYGDADMALRFTTPNGWGLSIIRTQPTMVKLPGYPEQPAGGSYGARAGLFEVALTRHGEVVFDGPILRQPEGWLTSADVARKLREVFELPEAKRP